MKPDRGEGNALVIAVIVILCLALAVAAFVMLDLFPEGEIPQDVRHRPLEEMEADEPVETALPEEQPVDLERETLAPAAPEKESGKKSGPAAERIEGTITGRFLDSGGMPVADVQVIRETRQPETLATSGPDGRFEADVSLMGWGGSRKLRLGAARPGYARIEREVLIEAGETAHLGDIVLAPGGALSGRVIDEQGAPVADARVSCHEPEISSYMKDRIRREGPFQSIAETRTGDDGLFRLESVAEGWVRVWASAEGTLYSYTSPVEVRAGQETFGIELVLDPLPPDACIEGIVLAPDGEPLPRARLKRAYRTDHGGGSSTFSAGEDGRFRCVLEENCPYSIEASDTKRRYGPVRVENVQPGTLDLVLRLTPLALFEVAVRFEGREAPERFVVNAFRPVEHRQLAYETIKTAELDENGIVELPVPLEAFEITVDADGFFIETLGPFDPTLLPGAPVEVVLTPVPGVRGVVTAGGAPVAGAAVTLHEAAEPGGELRVDGFLSRSRQGKEAEDETDGSGAFLLGLQESGVFYVRAEADGFAPAEVGPLTIDHEAGLDGLALKLGAGGAIEGTVLVPLGRSPAGVIVALSRGDGFVQTARTGPDGTYRFEHLVPGRWLVQESEEEIDRHGWGYSWRSMDEPSEIPWSCIVEEGKTTRFDLNLAGGAKCVLEGRLLLGGAVPAGWTASLFKAGAIFGTTVNETAVGVDGDFVLEVREPGAYKVNVNGRPEGGEVVYVSDRVDLVTGINTWSRNITVGRLEVTGVPETGERHIPLFFKWSGGGDLEAYAEIRPDEAGQAVLPAVPAGAGRIVKMVRASILGKRSEEVLAEVEIPANGTARVKLE